MAYLTQNELNELGFKYLGQNVKVSDKASIYDSRRISIGDHSRIDDFCVLSGEINIGRCVHVTPQCLIAGGNVGVFISDFVTLAYGVKIFTKSDDYSGQFMTNSIIPSSCKGVKEERVNIESFTIIGAGSVIFPGVNLAEGTSIGSMALVRHDTNEWGIYAGIPARRLKERSRNLLVYLDIAKKELDID